MTKYHVGIDVGKYHHHVSIREIERDTYNKTFSITNDHEGFEDLISSLERISDDRREFLIGIEACPYGINLSYFLMGIGFSLVEVNPFRVGQFRKAQGKKAKTDTIDARSIAGILSLGDHKPLSIPDQILDNLKELTRFRTDLVDEKATAIIHLRESLSILFPEFAKVFRQLDSPGSLAVLAAFPSPGHLIVAGEDEVGKTLSLASPHRMGRGMASRIIEAAKGTVGVFQKQQAIGIKISILAQKIASLQETICEIEKQITVIYNSLPNKLQGFPCGRDTSLAAIISEIGDIHRFATLKKFLSHLGWCPQSFQTGGYHMEHPRMSHAGNKHVRRLIWMLSIHAITRVPRYRQYFTTRVQEGKAKMHILIAIGRKLLSVLYTMLKKGIPYDPNWEENGHLATARH